MELDVEPLTNDVFVSYLRNALHYLYDPVHLRRSTLVKLLELDNEFDPAAALQQILTAAIHGLKPADDELPQSNAWRIYDALNLYYIRQYSRNMVATQLGVSERQLRREQRLALEALAVYLRKYHNLIPGEGAEKIEERGNYENLSADDVFDAELGWLKKPEFEQRSSIKDALDTVSVLVRPLSEQWRVPVLIDIEPDMKEFQVAQLVIRNILLTILSVVIPKSQQQQPIRITAARQNDRIEIRISCIEAQHEPMSFPEKHNDTIESARRLAALNEAELAIAHENERLTVRLTFSAPEIIPVLVIDDNSDWLDLLKRYAAGSRYQVIGSREPETALLLAEKLQPAVIFLDVMMPNIDGWQIISELRQERSTSHIPIIVCSILPLEGIALSLGVNAFLQKPITQSQFITMLEQHTRSAE